MGVPDPNTVGHMLTAWRKQDPKAARQYVLSIEDTTLRRQFLVAYFEGTDKEARAFASSLPPGGDRNAVVQGLAYGWATDDPAGALAYLQSEPDSPAGRDAAAKMVGGIGYKDPAAAFAWANQVPEGLRERAVVTALEHWRQKDITAAAAAVSAMPGGPLKTAATKALAK